MKISVVTISYNQIEYLRDCLASIAQQKGPWEHIIVDAGSTDGSRELIMDLKDQFSKIVFESDDGPADGLNKGFSYATGEIFYYLNSDDVVLPDAFEQVRRAFAKDQSIDVIAGSGYVLSASGERLRPVWSDQINRHQLAHGGSILIQQATFIRAQAFKSVSGFNKNNRSCWDAELILDLFLANAKFSVVDDFWGGFRIHQSSITGSAKLKNDVQRWALVRYEKLTGRPKTRSYAIVELAYRILRVVRHPVAILYRLKGVKVGG